jgi:heme O synthase-like polyprenyltransferase
VIVIIPVVDGLATKSIFISLLGIVLVCMCIIVLIIDVIPQHVVIIVMCGIEAAFIILSTTFVLKAIGVEHYIKGCENDQLYDPINGDFLYGNKDN